MAAHVDRHGESRNVRGHSLNIHAERGGTPAEALRADAEGVYPLQQLPLHRGVVFIRVRLIYRAQQRMLCKLRDVIKTAADASFISLLFFNTHHIPYDQSHKSQIHPHFFQV